MPPEAGDSRAIQLTQPGMAALAVVRLEGPLAESLVARHFGRPSPHRRCVYGRWRDGGEVLDDVVLVRDGAHFELSLHGGARIVGRLLEQAAAEGFDIVTGDPAIAAAARDDVHEWLPRALTERGLRLLLAQPAVWAALDPDQVDIQALLADQTLYRLLNPATVAIVGPANVGKSTLANALCGQERSIVADVPGTTRDWVGGLAELAGLPVILVDTPGRRHSDDAVERDAMDLARAPVASADLVIEVIDASAPPGEQPQEPDARSLRIANKCDLAPAPAERIAVSAKTGQGLEELVEEIHQRLGVRAPRAHRANLAFWWTEAHQALLRWGGAPAVRRLRTAICKSERL